jgi:hypothetical protein
MQKIQSLKLITAALVLSALSACGGGGSSSPVTKTGYFIDSAVAGLEYTSGSTTGITGADGSFQYEEGKPVTFKIGSMNLGSVTVKSNRIFPVDLVSGAADETDTKVSLMAQILQTLDSDGNPSNGITITDKTRKAMNQAIEVASADPTQTAAAINQLLANATADRATGPANALVNSADAKSHLNANLIKEFAGNWTGSFTGNDSGTCQVTVSQIGLIGGTCTSTLAGSFTISGRIKSSGSWQNASGATAASSSTTTSSTTSTVTSNGSGSASTGAVFDGSFTRAGNAAGTWVNSSSYAGTWTMTKQ